MSPSANGNSAPLWRRVPQRVGRVTAVQLEFVSSTVAYVGGVVRLVGGAIHRLALSLVSRKRVSRRSLTQQMVRVGVRSIPIIVLVQFFIGIILALNLAPTLDAYGQLESVADVVAIAVFRELGPLISAIVLCGFAGASIAAEIGTMVEAEELKAMRALALDPIRFLVAPRVFAATVMMVGLAVLADVVGTFGGLCTAVGVLGVSAQTYIDRTRAILTNTDYLTGLMKAGVFGLLIASLACYEGLRVRGGAEGVGRATTATVVKSIVSLIGADCVFTAIFYRLGW